MSIDGPTDLIDVRGNLITEGFIGQILLQHELVAAYGFGPEFILMHTSTELSYENGTFKRWMASSES